MTYREMPEREPILAKYASTKLALNIAKTLQAGWCECYADQKGKIKILAIGKGSDTSLREGDWIMVSAKDCLVLEDHYIVRLTDIIYRVDE